MIACTHCTGRGYVYAGRQSEPDMDTCPVCWGVGEIESGDVSQLENSNTFLEDTHLPLECKGMTCTLHNRTKHHMRAWAQSFDYRTTSMSRTCPHDVKHPDPDEFPWRVEPHDCDGCCVAEDPWAVPA